MFVTTSFVSQQAYEEVRSDQHPIVILSGADIAALLIDNGYPDAKSVRGWLLKNFPMIEGDG